MNGRSRLAGWICFFRFSGLNLAGFSVARGFGLTDFLAAVSFGLGLELTLLVGP